jgi:hypothetical protein
MNDDSGVPVDTLVGVPTSDTQSTGLGTLAGVPAARIHGIPV